MKIQSNESKNHPHHAVRMAKGFSLFEMVIVMGIIGLILGGAIFSMGRIRDSAAVSTANTDFKAFRSALEMYRNNGGQFPSTSQGLEALLTKPTDAPRPRSWVRVLESEDDLVDPWGTKYKYVFPGSKDSSIPEIISAGPDMQFGGDDDQSSQQ